MISNFHFNRHSVVKLESTNYDQIEFFRKTYLSTYLLHLNNYFLSEVEYFSNNYLPRFKQLPNMKFVSFVSDLLY